VRWRDTVDVLMLTSTNTYIVEEAMQALLGVAIGLLCPTQMAY